MIDSALYVGRVVHRRLAPRRHYMRYRLFQMLLDLDEAPALGRRMRLFSHNRFNVFSFHDRDHGDGRAGPLRGFIEEVLGAAGIAADRGKIRLLCLPRMFGHVFNPLSIYYCHAPDGRLAAMVYEVTNTYGERHSYVVPVLETNEVVVRQACAKALFVSPFMDMAMTYEFSVSRPAEMISTTVRGRTDDGRPMIVATFQGRRLDLSDVALLKVLLTHPLATLKVVAAIHLEAVKLLLKGIRPREHPPAPRCPITLVAAAVPAPSQNHQAIGLST